MLKKNKHSALVPFLGVVYAGLFQVPYNSGRLLSCDQAMINERNYITLRQQKAVANEKPTIDINPGSGRGEKKYKELRVSIK